jgi:hypothetical protein
VVPRSQWRRGNVQRGLGVRLGAGPARWVVGIEPDLDTGPSVWWSAGRRLCPAAGISGGSHRMAGRSQGILGPCQRAGPAHGFNVLARVQLRAARNGEADTGRGQHTHRPPAGEDGAADPPPGTRAGPGSGRRPGPGQTAIPAAIGSAALTRSRRLSPGPRSPVRERSPRSTPRRRAARGRRA